MEIAILRPMVAVTTALILFTTGTVSAERKLPREIRQENLKQCQGRFKNKRLTEEELKRVLNDHKVWGKIYLKIFDTQRAKSDPRKANLCGASLSGTNLSGASLWFANLSAADLSNVNLSAADLWGANLSGVTLWGADLTRASLGYVNLSGADLSGANLSGASLWFANLSGASLWFANLSGASLGHTDLNGAKLWDTNLSGTKIFNANLSGASLSGADLSGADLSGVNFSGASLWGADLSGAKLLNVNLSGATLVVSNLSGANLRGVNLSGACLAIANLSNAVFDPKDLPNTDDIASAKNLSQMWYQVSPQPLVKLRNAFKGEGYFQQEREVTCSIQRSETRNLAHKRNFLSSFEAMFRYVFFDLTCQWGMAPGRALLILLTLIPLFAIPYIITLRLPSQDGIWLKWADDRTRLDIGTQEPTRCYVGWVKATALGLYFSLLSAFNIGWREFNVGIWIQRLQTKEYTLKATGLVRTVSGLQSLISSYLLAIWALTYFGRPFD